jgi:hypothetical protein
VMNFMKGSTVSVVINNNVPLTAAPSISGIPPPVPHLPDRAGGSDEDDDDDDDDHAARRGRGRVRARSRSPSSRKRRASRAPSNRSRSVRLGSPSRGRRYERRHGRSPSITQRAAVPTTPLFGIGPVGPPSPVAAFHRSEHADCSFCRMNLTRPMGVDA